MYETQQRHHHSPLDPTVQVGTRRLVGLVPPPLARPILRVEAGSLMLWAAEIMPILDNEALVLLHKVGDVLSRNEAGVKAH